MCQDFSGVITEKGEVLWLKEDTANHNAVQNKFGLKDVNDGKTWVRFEIHYKDLGRISRNREDAEFQWDCQTLPVWAEKNAVKLIAKAWVAWDESRKTAVILEGETVREVKDYYVAHCLGIIESVYGSATIESVYGSATIESVYGSATIKYVSGSATIEYVYGSATIESVCDSATIKYVSGSATIKYVYDSATIKYVSGSATIEYVYGSATIESVCDSATIEYVYDSATIKYVYDSATIKYVYDSATIKSVCGSATIEKIEEYATAQKNGILYLAKGAKVRKLGKLEGKA